MPPFIHQTKPVILILMVFLRFYFDCPGPWTHTWHLDRLHIEVTKIENSPNLEVVHDYCWLNGWLNVVQYYSWMLTHRLLCEYYIGWLNGWNTALKHTRWKRLFFQQCKPTSLEIDGEHGVTFNYWFWMGLLSFNCGCVSKWEIPPIYGHFNREKSVDHQSWEHPVFKQTHLGTLLICS